MSEAVISAACGMHGMGKTHTIQAIIGDTRRTLVVYNYGDINNDWVGFAAIELAWDKKGEKLYFFYKKKRYDLERSFMKLFKGKRVKIRRVKLGKRRALEEFVELMNDQYTDIKDLVFVVDDATLIVRYRLVGAFGALVSQSKHSRAWLIFMYHQLNYIPNELLGFLTHLHQFKTTTPPSAKKKEFFPGYDAILKAWHWLQLAPERSCAILETSTRTTYYKRYKE